MGFGIEGILEIIQPVSLDLATYDHGDFLEYTCSAQGHEAWWVHDSFFLELILEYLSLSIPWAKSSTTRHYPEDAGKLMKRYVVGPRALT